MSSAIGEDARVRLSRWGISVSLCLDWLSILCIFTCDYYFVNRAILTE